MSILGPPDGAADCSRSGHDRAAACNYIIQGLYRPPCRASAGIGPTAAIGGAVAPSPERAGGRDSASETAMAAVGPRKKRTAGLRFRSPTVCRAQGSGGTEGAAITVQTGTGVRWGEKHFQPAGINQGLNFHFNATRW